MSLEKAIAQSDPPVERLRIDRLLTVQETSRSLKISVGTLKDMRRNRFGIKGPDFIRVGWHVRYRATDIMRWLRARTRRVVRQRKRKMRTSKGRAH
jgi:hypothetical protein